MGVIFSIAGKDLKLLWRDKAGMFFVLVFPLIYALFFGAIFSRSGDGGSKISVAIVDEDNTEESRALIGRLAESTALKTEAMDLGAAREAVRKGDKTAFIHLREGYGGDSMMFQFPTVAPRVVTDPSRGAERGVLQGVMMEAIFAPFQQSFSDPNAMRKQARESLEQLRRSEDMPAAMKLALSALMSSLGGFADSLEESQDQLSGGGPISGDWIEFADLERDNKLDIRNSYEITFPSSILWGILGCAAGFAVTLVRERASGTLQRLRTAPIGRVEILAGKGLACFLSCATVITILLLFGKLVFGIRLDPAPLALAIVCTALCFVGIMMAVSVIGRTEQAVAGAGWAIFVMLAMFGGGMVPLFVMPEWMLGISDFSPVKWGIYSLEGAIWRDFSMAEMLGPCGVLLGIGALCFSIGLWRMPTLE